MVDRLLLHQGSFEMLECSRILKIGLRVTRGGAGLLDKPLLCWVVVQAKRLPEA